MYFIKLRLNIDTYLANLFWKEYCFTYFKLIVGASDEFHILAWRGNLAKIKMYITFVIYASCMYISMDFH